MLREQGSCLLSLNTSEEELVKLGEGVLYVATYHLSHIWGAPIHDAMCVCVTSE